MICERANEHTSLNNQYMSQYQIKWFTIYRVGALFFILLDYEIAAVQFSFGMPLPLAIILLFVGIARKK